MSLQVHWIKIIKLSFFDTINNLKKNKTILIIAHKFDSLDTFDNVFELKSGIIKKH